MKFLKHSAISFIAIMAVHANAQTRPAVKYELTITNGASMPISPAVVYTKNGGEAAVQIGSAPTAGFVQLCQTGNTSVRLTELKADATVQFTTQTIGMIQPGDSQVIEVEVADPKMQSIHLETMYGKSKDACGVATVNSHSLVALKEHVTSEVVQKDSALSTGAFQDPTLPTGDYLESALCPSAMNAVSCLRELSTTKAGKAQVRYFSGYFPSLVNALETKFGAADVQTLLFPTSGAIQLKLKLKH